MAGNPNPKGSKPDKIWRDAITRAVRRLGGDEPPKAPTEAQRLELLADALVAKGIDGDVPALREIGDRLDGKPTQAIEHSGEMEHNYVAHIPAPCADLDDWEKLYAAPLRQRHDA